MLERDSRALVRERVAAVVPFDEREAAVKAEVLGWIDPGAPLFRTRKQATPPRHLAVYVALLDKARRSVLLAGYVKARAWLLPDGHVDDGEEPARSAEREAFEELGISPEFHPRLGGGHALFLGATPTRGEHRHTDATLWFAFAGDRDARSVPDPGEFAEVRWFSLEGGDWCAGCSDPHMGRFVRKLTSALDRGIHD